MLGKFIRECGTVPMRSAIALLAGLMLAACAPSGPPSEEMVTQRQQFGRPYQVERTVHTHLVPVSATNSKIGEQQYRDLYSFLIGSGARTGDVVVLASRRSRLDHRGQVQEFLRSVGVRPVTKLITDPKAGAEDDGYGEAILVQFDLYLPQQHVCGQWGEEVKTTYYNTPLKNFGCTTTNAMQQQVAYPSSLIEGNLLAFPEADNAAKPVTGYFGRVTGGSKAPETAGGG